MNLSAINTIKIPVSNEQKAIIIFHHRNTCIQLVARYGSLHGSEGDEKWSLDGGAALRLPQSDGMLVCPGNAEPEDGRPPRGRGV